mgnify:FL=1
MEIAIQNLNRIRYAKRITYSELAKMTGYSKNSIQKLFSYRNVSKCRLDIVVAVCMALDIDFPSIFKRGVVDTDSQKSLPYKKFDKKLSTESYLNNFVNRVRFLNSNGTNYSIKTISGLSESTISDLLNLKTKNPRLETLLKIAKGLDVSVDEIFR